MVDLPGQRGQTAGSDPTFGAELRRRRQNLGWSLERLATEAHYSHGQLSKIENGRKPPTRELAEACDRALRADGELLRLVPVSPRRGGERTGRPIDLPPAAGVFVGRDNELNAIVSHLSSRPSRIARVVVIHGAPGSGKTQLAVQAASRLLDQYTDGCLFLDLDDIEAESDVQEATGRLLRRLGLPPDVVPDKPAEQVAFYRRATRDRRLLLVLDNPTGAGVVAALVPPGGGAGVLVAARRPLRALDESLDIRLGGLRVDDARDLFVRIAGSRAGPAALVDRATLACQYLPLAVRIAAARLRSASALTTVGLVAQLEDGPGSLTVLDDGTRSAARAFDAACAALQAPVARMFALLSVYPGRIFDDWSVAALAAPEAVDTTRVLAELADAALLDPLGDGHYGVHSLVRAASARYAATVMSVEATDVARRQLLGAYLAAAQQADILVTPSRYRPKEVQPTKDAPVGPFGSPAEAAMWLDDQQDTLVLLVEMAAAHGCYEACWKLTYALRDHFFRTRALSLWIRTHTLALAAAEERGDRWAVAVTANNLGLAHALIGRPTEADEHYTRALAVFRELADAYGEANSYGHLAWTAYMRDEATEAMTKAHAALRIYQGQGATRNIAITLRTLALAEAAAGRTPAALAHLREALQLFVTHGLIVDEAMTLNCLGEVAVVAGRAVAESLQHHIRAWRRARAGGTVSEEARALRGMADAAFAVGRDASAVRLQVYADALDHRKRYAPACT